MEFKQIEEELMEMQLLAEGDKLCDYVAECDKICTLSEVPHCRLRWFYNKWGTDSDQYFIGSKL